MSWGVYLNPPARAAVFNFDEKTQCQALDRTQPSRPMVKGRAATMTHDYKRNGTQDTRDIEVVGAQRPSTLAPALHPDLVVVVQPCRKMVQGTHRQTATPRSL